MPLFRKPKKGDHVYFEDSKRVVTVLSDTDWGDHQYNLNKDRATIVDITPVKEPRIGYINIYRVGNDQLLSGSSISSTRKEADEICGETLRQTRFACIRFVEGQFDD